MGIKVEEKLSEDVSGQSQTHGCLNGNFYHLNPAKLVQDHSEVDRCFVTIRGCGYIL